MKDRNEQRPGVGVDAFGNQTIDPTANVIALIIASERRQDDLRKASENFLDAKANHIRELGELRASHQKELDSKESSRIDAVRQIDQAAVRELSIITANLAENLRKDLASTASALADSYGKSTAVISDRIAALEKMANQGSGQRLGANALWGYLVAAITLAILLYNLRKQ